MTNRSQERRCRSVGLRLVPTRFNIYALTEPQTTIIRYIGQSYKLPEWRLKDHIGQSRQRNYPVLCWLREIRANGKSPGVMILDHAESRQQARALEKWYIAAHRVAGFPLLNDPRHGKKLI